MAGRSAFAGSLASAKSACRPATRRRYWRLVNRPKRPLAGVRTQPPAPLCSRSPAMHARTLLFTALVATFARSATWAAERQTEPDFVRDVQPILTAHCIACHGPDKQENGLRLDSGGGVMRGGDSGPAGGAGK